MVGFVQRKTEGRVVSARAMALLAVAAASLAPRLFAQTGKRS